MDLFFIASNFYKCGNGSGQLHLLVRQVKRAFSLLIVAQTIGFITWQAPARADSNQVINLNNQGVKALNAGTFSEAVKDFQAALNLDPSYQLARDNLAIAHNNYGLQLKNDPKKALKEFQGAATHPG